MAAHCRSVSDEEKTMIRAMDMIMLWIKSVVDAARNPPRVVYATIITALMIMAVR